MNLTELKTQPVSTLVALGESMGLENLARLRKQDIIFSILKQHAKSGEDIFGNGALEILQDGFGFLRSADSSYLAGLMIFMSRPAKFGALTCAQAIPSRVKFGRRKTASATSRY